MTLSDAQIHSDLQKIILLHSLANNFSRVHDIFSVFENCIQKSPIKPADEIWFVRDKGNIVGEPIRNLMKKLSKENLISKVGRGNYSITSEGKEFLVANNLSLVYLNIITTTTKRIDSMIQFDKLHKVPMYVESPLYEKYFCSDNRQQLNEKMSSLLNCSYFACVQPFIKDPQKEILWIGTFGFKGEKKSLLLNEDIVLEEITGFTDLMNDKRL